MIEYEAIVFSYLDVINIITKMLYIDDKITLTVK